MISRALFVAVVLLVPAAAQSEDLKQIQEKLCEIETNTTSLSMKYLIKSGLQMECDFRKSGPAMVLSGYVPAVGWQWFSFERHGNEAYLDISSS